MVYLYFLYDSTGCIFRSEWINSNGSVARVSEAGKGFCVIFPCAQLGQKCSEGILMSGKSLTYFPAFRSTSPEGCARRRCIHWGRGGLETNKNILGTLQALVESTCHLPADNRLGTFQMFLQVPGRTHDVGTFMEHFECNINMCNTFDPP